MVQLAQWQDKFAALGVNVAAMTYDAETILADFHAEQKLSYPLLRDEDVRHVTALGIRNEEYGPGHMGYGIPHPGILYIKPDGTIAAKYAVPGYRSRPPLEEIYGQISVSIAARR